VSPRRPLLRGSQGSSGWCQRQRTPTRVRRLLRVVLPRPFFRCFISPIPWLQPRVIFIYPSDPHTAPPALRVSTSGIRAAFQRSISSKFSLWTGVLSFFHRGGTTSSTTREVSLAVGTICFSQTQVSEPLLWKAWLLCLNQRNMLPL
jgi:hypothetical protein